MIGIVITMGQKTRNMISIVIIVASNDILKEIVELKLRLVMERLLSVISLETRKDADDGEWDMQASFEYDMMVVDAIVMDNVFEEEISLALTV